MKNELTEEDFRTDEEWRTEIETPSGITQEERNYIAEFKRMEKTEPYLANLQTAFESSQEYVIQLIKKLEGYKRYVEFKIMNPEKRRPNESSEYLSGMVAGVTLAIEQIYADEKKIKNFKIKNNIDWELEKIKNASR